MVKVYFEFSTHISETYSLSMDELKFVSLQQDESVWYEFIPETDFSIKFHRAKGYPLLKVVECEEENVGDCLEQNKKELKIEVEKKKKID